MAKRKTEEEVVQNENLEEDQEEQRILERENPEEQTEYENESEATPSEEGVVDDASLDEKDDEGEADEEVEGEVPEERPHARSMRSGKTVKERASDEQEEPLDLEEGEYEEPSEAEEGEPEELESEDEKRERFALEQLERERIKQEEQQKREAEKQRKREEKQKRKEEKKKLRETPEYKRKRRITAIILGAIILVILIVAAVFLIKRYAKFSGYNVTANIDMTNLDEHTQVYKFHNGYIKCGGDGVTYFDKNGIIWSEGLSMADPICDVCGEYIAVCDMKSTEVYLFGTGGFLNKISLLRVATDVEISKYGSIAVLTNEGEANYIEIKDKEGNDIINIKIVFSSTGYPSDISLSSDGTKLVASFISVADSNIGSKVIFYDLSKNDQNNENTIVAEFDQYDNTLVTHVEFLNDNRVVAVGDNAFTIYGSPARPEVIYEEKDIPWQIQSLFTDDNHIGFIAEGTESDNAYNIKAYDLNGRQVCEEPFDLAYDHVAFAGSNVVLYTDYDCDVINFAGTHKFSGSFDNRIYYLLPYDDGVNYILLSSGHTQFIKLR